MLLFENSVVKRISAIIDGFELAICLFFLGICSAFCETSTADETEALKQKYQQIVGGVVGEIQALPDHPAQLQDGTLAGHLQTATDTDLKAIGNRIEQQKQILNGKLQGIANNSALSKDDKNELSSAIRSQTAPLDDLRSKVETLSTDLKSLLQSGLQQWKDTYEQFRAISGDDRALEKLRASVGKFCARYDASSSQPKPSPAVPLNRSRSVADGRGTPPQAASETYDSLHRDLEQLSKGLLIRSAVPGLANPAPNPVSVPPVADALPYQTQEMPVRKGVVRSITPGSGSLSITIGNTTSEKQGVRFRVIILNRDGIELSNQSAGWIFKSLDPGSEQILQSGFTSKEPDELKFSSLHAGFDSTPAWILLRSSDSKCLDGTPAPALSHSAGHRNHRQDVTPAVTDLIPINSDQLRIGRGILKGVSFLQGKMNVTLRNESSEKKPVAVRFYFLSSNGIILDQKDVHWWFKQLDPGSQVVETVSLHPTLPESLKNFRGRPSLDTVPRYLIIRSTDDSPYRG